MSDEFTNFPPVHARNRDAVDTVLVGHHDVLVSLIESVDETNESLGLILSIINRLTKRVTELEAAMEAECD